MTDHNSDNVFPRKKFLFGAEARCNGGCRLLADGIWFRWYATEHARVRSD
ncbi:hypothetical protein O5699_01180 [Escherichia coli]|nr:hypothetical protein [Escherichia coli]